MFKILDLRFVLEETFVSISGIVLSGVLSIDMLSIQYNKTTCV